MPATVVGATRSVLSARLPSSRGAGAGASRRLGALASGRAAASDGRGTRIARSERRLRDLRSPSPRASDVRDRLARLRLWPADGLPAKHGAGTVDTESESDSEGLSERKKLPPRLMTAPGPSGAGATDAARIAAVAESLRPCYAYVAACDAAFHHPVRDIAKAMVIRPQHRPVRLDLRGAALTDGDAAALAAGLRRGPTLSELRLGGCGLGPEAAGAVTAALVGVIAARARWNDRPGTTTLPGPRNGRGAARALPSGGSPARPAARHQSLLAGLAARGSAGGPATPSSLSAALSSGPAQRDALDRALSAASSRGAGRPPSAASTGSAGRGPAARGGDGAVRASVVRGARRTSPGSGGGGDPRPRRRVLVAAAGASLTADGVGEAIRAELLALGGMDKKRLARHAGGGAGVDGAGGGAGSRGGRRRSLVLNGRVEVPLVSVDQWGGGTLAGGAPPAAAPRPAALGGRPLSVAVPGAAASPPLAPRPGAPPLVPIRTLDLSGNALCGGAEAAGAWAVIPIVAMCGSLRRLCLRDTALPSAVLCRLAEVLERGQSLAQASPRARSRLLARAGLSSSPTAAAGPAGRLAGGMRGAQSGTAAAAAEDAAEAEAAMTAMAARRWPLPLRSLDLGGNRVGGAGAAALARVARLCRLRELSLDGASLQASTHPGAAALLRSVASAPPNGGPGLASLSLDRCGLDDPSCAGALAELVGTSTSLTSLRLGHNRLGPDFATRLTAVLARGPATPAAGAAAPGGRCPLAALDVSGNPLGLGGTAVLVAAVSRCRLAHLLCDGTLGGLCPPGRPAAPGALSPSAPARPPGPGSPGAGSPPSPRRQAPARAGRSAAAPPRGAAPTASSAVPPSSLVGEGASLLLRDLALHVIFGRTQAEPDLPYTRVEASWAAHPGDEDAAPSPSLLPRLASACAAALAVLQPAADDDAAAAPAGATSPGGTAAADPRPGRTPVIGAHAAPGRRDAEASLRRACDADWEASGLPTALSDAATRAAVRDVFVDRYAVLVDVFRFCASLSPGRSVVGRGVFEWWRQRCGFCATTVRGDAALAACFAGPEALRLAAARRPRRLSNPMSVAARASFAFASGEHSPLATAAGVTPTSAAAAPPAQSPRQSLHRANFLGAVVALGIVMDGGRTHIASIAAGSVRSAIDDRVLPVARADFGLARGPPGTLFVNVVRDTVMAEPGVDRAARSRLIRVCELVRAFGQGRAARRGRGVGGDGGYAAEGAPSMTLGQFLSMLARGRVLRASMGVSAAEAAWAFVCSCRMTEDAAADSGTGGAEREGGRGGASDGSSGDEAGAEDSGEGSDDARASPGWSGKGPASPSDGFNDDDEEADEPELARDGGPALPVTGVLEALARIASGPSCLHFVPAAVAGGAVAGSGSPGGDVTAPAGGFAPDDAGSPGAVAGPCTGGAGSQGPATAGGGGSGEPDDDASRAEPARRAPVDAATGPPSSPTSGASPVRPAPRRRPAAPELPVARRLAALPLSTRLAILVDFVYDRTLGMRLTTFGTSLVSHEAVAEAAMAGAEDPDAPPGVQALRAQCLAAATLSAGTV